MGGRARGPKGGELDAQRCCNLVGFCLDFVFQRSTLHPNMSHPRVASLHVYPVKGCKGIDVEAAYFERTGKLADCYLACCIVNIHVQQEESVIRSSIRSHVDGSSGQQREIHYAATAAQVCP